MTEMIDASSAPAASIRFLYSFCRDIAAVRAFYTDVLRMEERSHMDDESVGWLNYQSDGLEFMFFRWDYSELEVERDWAWQPGDGAGKLPILSYSIHVPEEEYPATVGRIVSSGCPTMTHVPTWRQDSYWGLTVKDPAGNTVEVYTSPLERPTDTTWPDA